MNTPPRIELGRDLAELFGPPLSASEHNTIYGDARYQTYRRENRELRRTTHLALGIPDDPPELIENRVLAEKFRSFVAVFTDRERDQIQRQLLGIPSDEIPIGEIVFDARRATIAAMFFAPDRFESSTSFWAYYGHRLGCSALSYGSGGFGVTVLDGLSQYYADEDRRRGTSR